MTASTATPPPPPELLAADAFPSEIREVLGTLRRAGYAAYVVGGSVRDLLLGQPVKDFDVATSARAERVVQLFRRVVPTGIKHGTVTVMVRRHAVEVTTFRGEGAYRDGRRPETVFFLDNIVEDLARRDFTINAMAFDPTGPEFVDPFGGREDLQRRVVRCVRDARERFSEDGLRPLRAVRFASVLGFEIDPPTLAAIPETLATFAKVARERVRDEVVKLLLGRDPARGLALLHQTGLLARILPDVDALAVAAADADAKDPRFARTLARVAAVPPELELRLAAILADVGDPSTTAPPSTTASLRDASAQGERSEATAQGERSDRVEAALESLRLPRRTSETVAALVADRNFGFEPYPTDADLRRALSRVGAELAPSLLALGHADARAAGSAELDDRVSHLEHRIQQVLAHQPPLSASALAIDGKRIMQLANLTQGREVGNALKFLLDRVLDDPTLNTAESLERLVESWAVDRTSKR